MVLTLRTYALWERSKLVLWSLHILNFSGFLFQIVLAIKEAGRVINVYNPLPAPYNGCFIVFNGWTWERLVPSLIFETIVAILMVLKFVEYARRGNVSRIAYVLFRDGFVEFAAVAITSIFSLSVEIFQRDGGTLLTLSFDLISAVSIVCCSRLLLNIRCVMKLSSPNDRPEPPLDKPWSLDSFAFDMLYGITVHVEEPGVMEIPIKETALYESQRRYEPRTRGGTTSEIEDEAGFYMTHT